MVAILGLIAFLFSTVGIEWLYRKLVYLNIDTVNSEAVHQFLLLMLHHNYITTAIVMAPICFVVSVLMYKSGRY